MAVHFRKSAKPVKIPVLEMTVIPILKRKGIDTTLYRPSRLS